MMNTEKRIFLVAGGTGGHIWPAVSFGRWIEENKHGVKVDFICGNRPLEKEIYSAAEREPFVLSMTGSPLSGCFKEKCRRGKALFKAFSEVRGILKRTKPDFILLFGGYISFPVLLAARMYRIPVAIQEQNAFAGKVTRFAAAKKIPVFSGWQDCAPLKDGQYVRTGVPVRNFKLPRQNEAWKSLGFGSAMPAGKKVVVFTGSLGSSSVKEQICGIAAQTLFSGWTFILPAAAESREQAADNVYLLPKVWNTELLYSLADMAVMRAGASSLTEAGTLGIATLVIPWEKAADNHQFHNAVAFASDNAALVWNGKDERQFAKKLLQLEKLSEEKQQITSSKLYNNAEGICSGLWAEIAPHFWKE